jgi:oxygen-independent coproporphyrinogen-3 oxidase
VQLTSAGYVAIGIDHYADGNDDLAQAAFRGEVRRNFQGYTTDQAEMLIGLGASSIGKLQQGYVQNVVATHDYCRRVQGGELAVVRGFALSAVDRATAWLIENLMCSFSVSTVQLIRQFGVDAEALIDKAARIAAEDRDGFVTFDGDEFTITGDGRPFTRTIASWFDDYLASGKARHSAAV